MACSHPENRNSMINMEEWPEWILEILISNYEVITCVRSFFCLFTKFTGIKLMSTCIIYVLGVVLVVNSLTVLTAYSFLSGGSKQIV